MGICHSAATIPAVYSIKPVRNKITQVNFIPSLKSLAALKFSLFCAHMYYILHVYYKLYAQINVDCLICSSTHDLIQCTLCNTYTMDTFKCNLCGNMHRIDAYSNALFDNWDVWYAQFLYIEKCIHGSQQMLKMRDVRNTYNCVMYLQKYCADDYIPYCKCVICDRRDSIKYLAICNLCFANRMIQVDYFTQ